VPWRRLCTSYPAPPTHLGLPYPQTAVQGHLPSLLHISSTTITSFPFFSFFFPFLFPFLAVVIGLHYRHIVETGLLLNIDDAAPRLPLFVFLLLPGPLFFFFSEAGSRFSCVAHEISFSLFSTGDPVKLIPYCSGLARLARVRESVSRYMTDSSVLQRQTTNPDSFPIGVSIHAHTERTPNKAARATEGNHKDLPVASSTRLHRPRPCSRGDGSLKNHRSLFRQ
jgi:hypothetical protein